MIDSMRNCRLLKTWLWLMTAHSFAVGIGLIWHPAYLLNLMGYAPCSEPFFPTQGGVFHIVMAVGYSMATFDPINFRGLIIFSIVVKAIATVFLIIYWLANPVLGVVLFSGVVDGCMAVVLWYLNKRWLPEIIEMENP